MMIARVRPGQLYAWKGPSLLIVNAHGMCGSDQPLAGFYFREARILRNLLISLNGEQPWLCEASSPSSAGLTFTYVYPEITNPGGGGTGQSTDAEALDRHGVPERGLELRLAYQVGVAHLDVTLTLVNRARRPVACRLTCDLDADFADIQEAHAGDRAQNARVSTEVQKGVLRFTYEHTRLPLATTVHSRGLWTVDSAGLGADLVLQPRQVVTLGFRVSPSGTTSIPVEDEHERERAASEWHRRFAVLEAPGNRLCEKILGSNIEDFGAFPLLDGARDEWLSPTAGMPMYPAFFGRDAVTAGWQAAMIDGGDSLRETFNKLARLQSSRVDAWRDEQPGRIPYQVRTGPLAALNVNPYAAYYADYASPLMFVIALANLWVWTGDAGQLARHWDVVRRILDWAREYGDGDRDGYLEYQTRSPQGTKNQGWKDSGDAIVYDDGAPVPSPIATCELQGYWYAAQELMALMCAAQGQLSEARAYGESAAQLKARFNRDWWMADEQFYALALDPDKRQVRAVTSNVGHCIASGIVDRERLDAVVTRLFSPDLFSGWGIRTLSASHAFYDPVSYHRGSVWPVEQATIVFGLRRYGFDDRALQLSKTLFELAELYPGYRIPECVGGYAKDEWPTPGAYPQANTPQLWNATAFPLVMQAMLGIVPMAPLNTLVIDPRLPAWMPEVILRDVRIGDAKVTLRAWRAKDGDTKWQVLHREGSVHVVRQPPPESLSAGWAERLSALVETAIKTGH
jgi:glycogen debranching enzyme